jgi:hypothetical protein
MAQASRQDGLQARIRRNTAGAASCVAIDGANAGYRFDDWHGPFRRPDHPASKASST